MHHSPWKKEFCQIQSTLRHKRPRRSPQLLPALAWHMFHTCTKVGRYMPMDFTMHGKRTVHAQQLASYCKAEKREPSRAKYLLSRP
eukprot:4373291-Pleurochrysis_carterae.AAC.2